MGKIRCPKCRHRISLEDKYCDYCGCNIQKATEEKLKLEIENQRRAAVDENNVSQGVREKNKGTSILRRAVNLIIIIVRVIIGLECVALGTFGGMASGDVLEGFIFTLFGISIMPIYRRIFGDDRKTVRIIVQIVLPFTIIIIFAISL